MKSINIVILNYFSKSNPIHLTLNMLILHQAVHQFFIFVSIHNHSFHEYTFKQELIQLDDLSLQKLRNSNTGKDRGHPLCSRPATLLGTVKELRRSHRRLSDPGTFIFNISLQNKRKGGDMTTVTKINFHGDAIRK